MLCGVCTEFLTHVLHQGFHTWRRVEQGWFTFKIGNHATVVAAADAGCEMCALFNEVRCQKIPNYADLSDKWHSQTASIDVKPEDGNPDLAIDRTQEDHHLTPRWSFYLLTVAPEMSWIPFELFHPDDQHNQPTSYDELDPGCAMTVSNSPTSPQTLAIAQRWIYECLNNHPACRLSASVPLPTRVIDVGTSADNPTLRLQVGPNQHGQYVTLSHCWGVGRRLVLTQNTLVEFMNGIPYSALPRTFQDAICLTISLGVRYLWIDALCIVQDDTDDWRKESASMCSIFENACFSISALSATDSHSGMLAERNIPGLITNISGVRAGVRTRLHSLPEALQHSRLETRAWCYQERLLARAILHVATHQLYWECRSGSRAESRPQDNGPSKFASASSTPSLIPPAERDSASWLRLVTEYSARQITEPLDRLPAIAGLAYRESGDNRTYMQGLWSGDEHAGLMWRRQPISPFKILPSRDTYLSRLTSRESIRPEQSIASSWSWASINDAAEYPISVSHPLRLTAKSDAKFVVDNHTKQELPHADIAVRGLVRRGTCKLSTDVDECGCENKAMFRASGSTLVNEGVACFLDYNDDPVSRGCYCLRIANWTSTTSKATRKRQESASTAGYLILEKIGSDEGNTISEESERFKRIGMGFDVAAKVDKLFLNAQWRDLQLV